MIGVYVHLPFCLRKCPYCAFFSESNAAHKMESYVRRIIREAAAYPAQEVASIYFGGGTPTALPPTLLTELLEALNGRFPCSGEITIEANPATVTPKTLFQLRSAGFNRISIGVQSLIDSELETLGRLHTAADAVQAVKDAASAGFTNISADVMFGLPKQTCADVSKTLNGLLSLSVTHISTYSLSIEEGTPFASRCLSLPSEEDEREMYYTIRDTLQANGFVHYEISNFALPGREAVHNTNYWECGEYIGLGAGAHGYLHSIRYANIENIDAYLKSEDPVVSKTPITIADKKEEHYMLGLRMRKGVKNDGNPNIPRLVQDGLLEQDGDYIRLSARGLDIANYVITELCT